jgi:hypothetical protein
MWLGGGRKGRGRRPASGRPLHDEQIAVSTGYPRKVPSSRKGRTEDEECAPAVGPPREQDAGQECASGKGERGGEREGRDADGQVFGRVVEGERKQRAGEDAAYTIGLQRVRRAT